MSLPARISVETISLLLLTACATSGATLGSGVGDAWLERPPWVAGVSQSTVRNDTTAIGHLPVRFHVGATRPAAFEPGSERGSAIDSLRTEMNAFLDSMRLTSRLLDGERVSAVAHRVLREAPDVRFGCSVEVALAELGCPARGDSALGRGRQQMQLSVGRASAAWRTWIQEVGRAQQVSRVLVITLEVGDYLVRQRGLAGHKEVDLGTGHTVRLPWLTSVESPVAVLQVTAALVGLDGRVIRMGAEGFHVRRTPLLVSAIDGQALLTDDDVRAARVRRREDLPGKPLAWEVALRQLLSHVTGREFVEVAR